MQTRYTSGSSVAYDLEKFQSKQRIRDKKPTLVVARPSEVVRAKARMASVLKLMAAVVLVVGIVITMLYSRAVLTELNQKIDTQSSRLAEEQSESTRLTAELEAKISLRNVEEYASQTLGMSPMDKHQITYVDLSEGDKIELTSESPKQTLVDRIQLAISNVQEYIPQD